jgi:hypothetical protein
VVQIDFRASKMRLLPSSDVTGEANIVKLKLNRGVMLASVGIGDHKPQW